MLLRPKATRTDHGGPRTSDLTIERRRRNYFYTSGAFFFAAISNRINKMDRICNRLSSEHVFEPFPILCLTEGVFRTRKLRQMFTCVRTISLETYVKHLDAYIGHFSIRAVSESVQQSSLVHSSSHPSVKIIMLPDNFSINKVIAIRY